MSNSSMKSPYSFSVTKKLLGLFFLMTPTIASSSTKKSALPVSCFHPDRSWPLNNGVSFDGLFSWVQELMQVANIKNAVADCVKWERKFIFMSSLWCYDRFIGYIHP